MNKSYAFTGRSIKFWLGLFNFITTTKEDGIEKFTFAKIEQLMSLYETTNSNPTRTITLPVI